MDHSPPGCVNRPIMGCFVIIAAIIVLSSVMIGVVDIICYSQASKFMIPYPDAEITHIDYNFLRAKGIGRTIYYMETPEDPLVIQGWYGRLLGETAYDRNMTRVRYSANYNEDRTATEIVIASSCIQQLPNMGR